MPTYQVSGPFPFRGNPPGAEFEAKTDPVIERALSRGSIAEVTTSTPAPASAKPSGDAAPTTKEKK